MRRVPDWENRLVGTIESFRDRPFAWGVNDCCIFAGACLEAVTGLNPAAGFKGRYRTREEAEAILRGLGPGGLLGLLSRRFGPQVMPFEAQRGDLVVAMGEGGASIGILWGGRAAFLGEAFGHRGLVTLPLGQTLSAFRI